MDIKIRIRVGSIELDYEGEADYFKTELPPFISQLTHEADVIIESSCMQDKTATNDQVLAKGTVANAAFSVSTISSKLKVSTGSDLALAAAACLTFTDGREAFSRQELLKKMQEAKSYYKKSYGSNLSKTLATLVKSDALLEGTSSTYSLSAGKSREMRDRLGI